jgi:hypothetical protein
VQLQSEIEALKKSREESDQDRENEIRRIFDPMAGSESQESNLSLENDRLKNDLNQVWEPAYAIPINIVITED